VRSVREPCNGSLGVNKAIVAVEHINSMRRLLRKTGLKVVIDDLIGEGSLLSESRLDFLIVNTTITEQQGWLTSLFGLRVPFIRGKQNESNQPTTVMGEYS